MIAAAVHGVSAFSRHRSRVIHAVTSSYCTMFPKYRTVNKRDSERCAINSPVYLCVIVSVAGTVVIAVDTFVSHC